MYPMKERSTFVAMNIQFFLNVNFLYYSVKNAGGNTLKCVSCLLCSYRVPDHHEFHDIESKDNDGGKMTLKMSI